MSVLTEAWRAGRAERTERGTRRQPLLAVVARAVATLARRLPGWRQVRTAALTVPGLALIDYALYDWRAGAGIAAAGVSLLVLEWIGGRE